MHCSSSADPRELTLPHNWRRGAATLLTLLACAGTAIGKTGAVPGFKVRSAETRLVDGVHQLDARIDFDFSDEAEEAMENGVALTVSVEMQVLERNRVWDTEVAEVNARYRIQAHALSRQYLVRNLSTGETATYRDFQEMLGGIGEIRDFPLLDDHVLERDERYRVRIRASLELESLPTPLRLLAYFKSAWRLSSDWTTWPLER